ncbi:hypothetical protein C874_17245 [Elizabethkingia anophelis 502]|nr:hypothetical protein C874_17245 [Elizabethkingia anophelis 502]
MIFIKIVVIQISQKHMRLKIPKIRRVESNNQIQNYLTTLLSQLKSIPYLCYYAKNSYC